MALTGVSTGEFDIMSEADNFFGVIVEDMSAADTEFDLLDVERVTNTVIFRMRGFLIPRSYTAITSIKVTPRGDEAEGSHVTWNFAFEKFRDDIVNPNFIIDLFISYLNETDRNLSP